MTIITSLIGLTAFIATIVDLYIQYGGHYKKEIKNGFSWKKHFGRKNTEDNFDVVGREGINLKGLDDN